MMVLRPLNTGDLDDLYELAGLRAHGLTTLPQDRDILGERLEFAEASLRYSNSRPAGQLYFFGLEDTSTGRIVGTSAIVSKVGGFEPFYAYKIKTVTHQSDALNIRKRHRILNLVENHDGPTEIGSLFLHPDYRTGANGKLLSLSRFLYMAEFSERFESNVIAELRGVVDDEGYSPFWEAIGEHFFTMDFPTADYLSMLDKRFIADLMPRQPIYIDMLPVAAKKVINRVHRNTKPALAILEKEGFQRTGMVDIFEAGPVISCRLPDIRTVRLSKRVRVVDVVTSLSTRSHAIVMRPDIHVRASVGRVRRCSGGIEIERELARGLSTRKGAMVRYISLGVSG